MANFALVKDGIVHNVIVADSIEIAGYFTGYDCIPITESLELVDTDGTYDYSTKKFTPPPLPESTETKVV